MTRRLGNWLHSYLRYNEGTEAPKLFHFWIGVSTIAGALRKHVWLDMIRFKWTPSFYIILVAPPGVATKTTTLDTGHSLLRKIAGIKFGPDIVTWQGLVKKFAESQEEFAFGEEYHPMSALTIGSGELGNLLNPRDPDMVNLLITLWDGKSRIDKETKMSGNETISAPWVNLAGCTTPDWIANNVPPSMVGGGFVSRCIFIYRDEKENFVAWPDEVAPSEVASLEEDLLADLEHIAVNLIGPMTLTPAARKWGREWYERLWGVEAKAASDDQVKGYLARKQGHLVKTSIVLSVSRGDSMLIEEDDLKLADLMLKDVESSYSKVFSRIGMNDFSARVSRVLEVVKRAGRITYVDCYRQVHAWLADPKEFGAAIDGLVRSGQIKIDAAGAAEPMKWSLVYVDRV